MAKILRDYSYTFDDVLIKPQYSEIKSRDQVDISIEIVPGLVLKSPIMSANMQTVNSVELCVALYEAGGLATLDQFRSIEDEVDMLKQVKAKKAKVAGAVGTSKDFLERATALIKEKVDLIIMDTPHAHNSLTKDALLKFRKKFPKFPIIVGNVATSEAAHFLIHHGVNGIKVGVGPGAACLTRVNTGAGIPQISAVMDCYDIARYNDVCIIADGGVKSPGSFAKAIAAGGCAVYMGSVFAGTDESPSEMIEKNGKKYKQYFGSSSVDAKIARAKKDPSYGERSTRHVEGDSGYTIYRGSVANVVNEFIMGLRSAMSYVGAKSVKEFQEKTVFIPVTTIGTMENGAHGIIYT